MVNTSSTSATRRPDNTTPAPLRHRNAPRRLLRLAGPGEQADIERDGQRIGQRSRHKLGLIEGSPPMASAVQRNRQQEVRPARRSVPHGFQQLQPEQMAAGEVTVKLEALDQAVDRIAVFQGGDARVPGRWFHEAGTAAIIFGALQGQSAGRAAVADSRQFRQAWVAGVARPAALPAKDTMTGQQGIGEHPAPPGKRNTVRAIWHDISISCLRNAHASAPRRGRRWAFHSDIGRRPAARDVGWPDSTQQAQ